MNLKLWSGTNSRKETTHRLHVNTVRDKFVSGVGNVRSCQTWFVKFRSGEFCLKEDPRSRRPSMVDNDILSMLESNRHLPTKKIAKDFGTQSTAEWHIKHPGFRRISRYEKTFAPSYLLFYTFGISNGLSGTVRHLDYKLKVKKQHIILHFYLN